VSPKHFLVFVGKPFSSPALTDQPALLPGKKILFVLPKIGCGRHPIRGKGQ
jgi:hypothetical protein